jgi:hypothetical protein
MGPFFVNPGAAPPRESSCSGIYFGISIVDECVYTYALSLSRSRSLWRYVYVYITNMYRLLVCERERERGVKNE